jgi:hypothetical protein
MSLLLCISHYQPLFSPFYLPSPIALFSAFKRRLDVETTKRTVGRINVFVGLKDFKRQIKPGLYTLAKMLLGSAKRTNFFAQDAFGSPLYDHIAPLNRDALWSL